MNINPWSEMVIEGFGTYSLFLFVYQVVLELFLLKPPLIVTVRNPLPE